MNKNTASQAARSRPRQPGVRRRSAAAPVFTASALPLWTLRAETQAV